MVSTSYVQYIGVIQLSSDSLKKVKKRKEKGSEMTATDDQMFFTVIKVSMLNIKYILAV